MKRDDITDEALDNLLGLMDDPGETRTRAEREAFAESLEEGVTQLYPDKSLREGLRDLLESAAESEAEWYDEGLRMRGVSYFRSWISEVDTDDEEPEDTFDAHLVSRPHAREQNPHLKATATTMIPPPYDDSPTTTPECFERLSVEVGFDPAEISDLVDFLDFEYDKKKNGLRDD